MGLCWNDDCPAEVKPNKWLCSSCWALVPNEMKKRLRDGWKDKDWNTVVALQVECARLLAEQKQSSGQ